MQRIFFRDGESCAIGAAIEGAGQRALVDGWYSANGAVDPYTLAMSILGVDYEFLQKIYRKNDEGQTREQIADWLDTFDIAKPKDAQTFDDFRRLMLTPVDVAVTA